jgi:hemoglobin
MKVIVGLSPRVLLRHFRTELKVRAHGIEKWIVARQVGFAQRLKVELYESLLLLVRDPKVPVNVDDVLKPELTSESVGASKGLGGEPSEVVHVCRHSLSEQGTENRIVKDLVVEPFLEPMYGFIAASVFVDRLHSLPSYRPALNGDYSCLLATAAEACRSGTTSHAILGSMESVYDAAGGEAGMLRLAHAWHARVLADEEVSHAFSHGYHPQHTERFAAYWSEALGGPHAYSELYGDESAVVRIHSGNGPHDEMDRRAIVCFDLALADAGLDGDKRLRDALYGYFSWATRNTMACYHESAADVPDGLEIPHWSWDGLTDG